MITVSMNSVHALTEGPLWFYQPILQGTMYILGWSEYCGYFDRGYSLPVYFVCPWIVRVSMDSFDRGYPLAVPSNTTLYILDGQSIHGYHGSCDRGYPLVLPSNTTCTSLVSQSIHGYRGRGYPVTLTANTTLYIFGLSEYPWVLQIL